MKPEVRGQKQVIAQRIKALRTHRNLTVDQFALAMGISRQAVFRLENGTRYLYFEEALRLCEVLTITPEQLAGRKLDYAKEVTPKNRARSIARPLQRRKSRVA